MPWTLYRYILREVLLILGLCTAILVTVLSFFVAIKPLSDGLLDAPSLIKFVLYTMPTVLGFALPFAGAFASTLVFMRIAGDNEIVACAASGISYFRVLLPIVALGLVLMALLLYLSNFVIPDYYKKAARTAQSDALTIVTAQLSQGTPVTFGPYVLYAEQARIASPDEIDNLRLARPPVKMIQLNKVAFGQHDDSGKMRWDYTARLASALLFQEKGRSYITIRLRDSVFYDPTVGAMQRAYGRIVDLGPLSPPNPFEDEPDFMSYPELARLGRQPESFPKVAEAIRALRISLGKHTLRHAFETDVLTDGVQLIGPLDGETFRITAAAAERTSDGGIRLTASPDRPVLIHHDRNGSPVWIGQAEAALVRFEANEFDTDPAVIMELQRARIFEPGTDQQSAGGHDILTLTRMHWPGTILTSLAGQPLENPTVLQLRELSAESPEFAKEPDIASAAERLRLTILNLHKEIVAQKHLRAASAVAAFLLLLLGAVLSIYLRNQMTLIVFFWSFMLAIVSLVMIHSGSKMVTNPEFFPALGMSVTWLGNVLLAIGIGTVYCRFARN